MQKRRKKEQVEKKNRDYSICDRRTNLERMSGADVGKRKRELNGILRHEKGKESF
jgi:hypothetical protein